jgi:hypothetical protein
LITLSFTVSERIARSVTIAIWNILFITAVGRITLSITWLGQFAPSFTRLFVLPVMIACPSALSAIFAEPSTLFVTFVLFIAVTIVRYVLWSEIQ